MSQGEVMAGGATQLAFLQSEFVPVPGGDCHYVPAIQNKSGELEALRQASLATRSKLTPLVEIVGRKVPPGAYKWETVVGWIKRIADAVGPGPCFLDVLRLSAGHPTTTPQGRRPVLSVIHEAARKRALAFVPVVPAGGDATREHMALVREAAAFGGRGVAVRYKPLHMALQPHITPAALLGRVLADLGVDVVCADLIVDLGYLSPDENLHVDDVSDVLTEVTAVGQWRSLVLLGTSMPSMLGGAVAEGSVGELPRREWDLWSALRRMDLGRLPTFGDYVVQHPEPPHTTGGLSMRANIRYTINGTTLVARARGPVVQEGREQYRELCQQIVSRPEFAGREFSWGDYQIAACARGDIGPGWQNLWRGAGSSHHLRLVTEEVSR